MTHQPSQKEERQITKLALQTVGLSKKFGAMTVSDDINFGLQTGARHALIGPNGAGKTTFINLVTGVLEPTSGSLFLQGTDITFMQQAARVKRGIARTFQITALFRKLCVLENVVLAICEREGTGGDILRAAKRIYAEEAYSILETLHLADDALTPVSGLAYGRQRMVEIAIALSLKPAVLLLDEPAAGVPKEESATIVDAIDRLPKEIAVLFIEHDMELVMRVSERITVLVQGAVLVEGTPSEIMADTRVRDVYLGDRRH